MIVFKQSPSAIYQHEAIYSLGVKISSFRDGLL